MLERDSGRKVRVPSKTHPWRGRYVPSNKDNTRDEFFVITPSSIIGYKSRGSGRANTGGGR